MYEDKMFFKTFCVEPAKKGHTCKTGTPQGPENFDRFCQKDVIERANSISDHVLTKNSIG